MNAQLDECCCGCSLRKGTLITGYVSLIGCALKITWMAIIQANLWEWVEKDEAAYHFLEILMIVEGTIVGFMTLASIILIFGTLTERSWCLITWVIVYRIVVGLVIFSIIHSISRIIYHKDNNSLVAVPFLIVFVGMTIYGSRVVISHWRNMKSGSSTLPPHTRLV